MVQNNNPEVKANDYVAEFCPSCGREYHSGNFCGGCGRKMVGTCNCWLKKQPFNCRQTKCLGYMLLTKKYRELKP
jgi:methionyl-tRNA synthetase